MTARFLPSMGWRCTEARQEIGMVKLGIFAVIIAGCCVRAPAWGDEAAPETEGGRYSFSKVTDGFVRLDMQSGEVSLCSRRAVGWTCQAVPEDRAVLENEIARLRLENAALKKEILSRGLPLPAGTLPEPPVVRDGDRAPQWGNHIDRLMTYVGRAWQRLVEAIARAEQQILKKS
jgi:hypothetical protein